MRCEENAFGHNSLPAPASCQRVSQYIVQRRRRFFRVSLAGVVVLEEGESEHRGWVYVWGGMVMAAWQKHLLPPPCGLVLMLHSVPRARH